MKTSFYSFEQNHRHSIVSSANLHGRWSAAGGAWRRRICLLWRVDIHILFLRFKRDWRPYRLYSTENEVISSVPQSASRSQRKSKNYFLTSVMIANHDGQHGNTRHEMSTCPKIFWDVRLAVRKEGAGELAPIRTGCFHFDLQQFYPFTPKKVNFKFLLQPHQKYHIRWYGHSSLRWKMIKLIPILTTSVTYTFLLKGWENVTFDLGNERLILLWAISPVLQNYTSID